MKLELTRRWAVEEATTGTMTIDGEPFCFTLEDMVRTVHGELIAEVKVPGKTAIPAGDYQVTMHRSPKFGLVPKVHDVPGFTDILIHAGNTAVDTAGCILVGFTRQPTSLQQSKLALGELIDRISSAAGRGEAVELRVREAPVLA